MITIAKYVIRTALRNPTTTYALGSFAMRVATTRLAPLIARRGAPMLRIRVANVAQAQNALQSAVANATRTHNGIRNAIGNKQAAFRNTLHNTHNVVRSNISNAIDNTHNLVRNNVTNTQTIYRMHTNKLLGGGLFAGTTMTPIRVPVARDEDTPRRQYSTTTPVAATTSNALVAAAPRRHYSTMRERERMNQMSRRPVSTTDGGMVESWPDEKINTGLNICQQGELHVLERFGKFVEVVQPGLYLAIPFVDRIKRVDMREKAIPIEPQLAISRDNVSVRMSGVVYLRFLDAKAAVYGHYSPLFACMQHSQSAMRAAIGELELDALFHDRAAINAKITGAISEAAAKWGILVLRYEVTEILPDETISEAMDRQAQAERIRREKVLQASGDKEAQILRSQGDLQARTNEAEAYKRELELHAQGRANAVLLEADAQARAIERVATAVNAEGGEVAARLDLAKNYMHMQGQIGSKSNTIFFGEQAGDISQMMARVAVAFNAGLANAPRNQPANPAAATPANAAAATPANAAATNNVAKK